MNLFTSISRTPSPLSRFSFSDEILVFSGPEEGQVQRAKVLTEDLLLVVRQEHAKMVVFLQHQQMELHQAQAQYAAYSAVAAVGLPYVHSFSSYRLVNADTHSETNPFLLFSLFGFFND